MNEEGLGFRVVRYCKHGLSEKELLELERWLDEKEEHRCAFQQMTEVYKQGRRVGCWQSIDEAQAWERISRQLPALNAHWWGMKWWKYAAVLIFLLGSVLLYDVLQDMGARQEVAIAQFEPGSRKAILRLSDGREVTIKKETACVLTEENGAQIIVGGQDQIIYEAGKNEQEKLVYNTIWVPRGGEYSLVLSDGTRVWLNAETELTYPAVFGKGERKLTLKGEACFDVVRDTARPFIVESLCHRVEVLGTRFNVSAYAGAATIKTTLLKGSVRVSNGEDELLLMPGEQAVAQEAEIGKREVDVQAVVAWVEGVFEFENMSLGEICDQLGRWYDVDFWFADPALKEITFTGAATRYRELDFMLQLLEELAHVRFQLENKVIRVSKK